MHRAVRRRSRDRPVRPCRWQEHSHCFGHALSHTEATHIHILIHILIQAILLSFYILPCRGGVGWFQLLRVNGFKTNQSKARVE